MGVSKLLCRYKKEDSGTRTPFLQRFSCGVGNVLLDITDPLLASFRLVFLMNVLGLSATNAGWLVVYGMVSHSILSPLTAFSIDQINIPFLSRKLGRRTSWHLVGAVVGVIVIPLYFSSCFPCQSNGGQWQLMMYIMIFNTFVSSSYSLMEIEHLSIIPVVAKDESEAVELNAWRFAFLSSFLFVATLTVKNSSKHANSCIYNVGFISPLNKMEAH